MMDCFTIGNSSSLVGLDIDSLKRLDEMSLDFIVTKTCTLNPLTGSKKPFYIESEYASINRQYLYNSGYSYYNSYRPSKPYIISVAGSPSELKELVCIKTTANLLEFNISCPNHPQQFKLEDLEFLPHKLSYGIKLPPYLYTSDIEEVSKLLCGLKEKTPLRYVVCCNALPNGIIDGKVGAVSGKSIKPISLFNSRYFKHNLSPPMRRKIGLSPQGENNLSLQGGEGYTPKIKVFGCGGISTVKDISDYYREGLDGVQMTTVFMGKGFQYVDNMVKTWKNSLQSKL